MCFAIFNFNIFPFLFFMLAVFQGRRVISWAKQLRIAGLPLTAKPQT